MATDYNLLTIRGPDPLNGLINPVPHAQLAEYKESWNGRVSECTRLLLCDWDNRFDLLRAMLPTARVGAGFGNALKLSPYGADLVTNVPFVEIINANRLTLNRLNPEIHPTMPTLVAVEGHIIEGIGYPGQAVTGINPQAIKFFQNTTFGGIQQSLAGRARIAVTYRTLPYATQVPDAVTNVDAQSELLRYVWRETKPAAQNLPIQGTFFRELQFNADGTGTVTNTPVIPEPAPKVYPSLRVIYHWKMVPAIPPSVYYQMSHLNQTTFDFPNFPVLGECPIGTMQYLTSEWTEPYYTWHGDLVYDIKHIFNFRQPGPNWRFRPHAGIFAIGIRRGPGALNLGALPLPTEANPEPICIGLGVFDYSELANLFKISTPLSVLIEAA